MADHWVTINGKHVLIGEGHDGSHNPATHTGDKTTDHAIQKKSLDQAAREYIAKNLKNAPGYHREAVSQFAAGAFGNPITPMQHQANPDATRAFRKMQEAAYAAGIRHKKSGGGL